MVESVAEILGRLRFAGGPVETLYLNQTRVREGFLGQLGAITSFTRTARREGSVEAPIIRFGAGLASEADVTWSLEEPIAQALVLRGALDARGALHPPGDAGPGQYVCFAGAGYLSRPGMLDDWHQGGLQEHQGLYEALEAERAMQESVLQMMEGPGSTMWLLTLDDGHSICASVLDNRWLSPGFPSWMHGDHRYEVLAMFRQRHETGIPLLAALHLSVKW